ncbi:hypothetical protein [Microbacterium sp. Leaf159]|uniref:hypothetical protein n=1 Tax=Microbacterium sp. Leaf159 TaxID=1736279 RepID=UPI0006FCD591|nr:hypothetical protein [Microbacterium sp. Leaf159]
MVEDDEPHGRFERAALTVRYRENLGFLAKSAKAFDCGDHAEALRMATAIRTLSYDEGRGSSILMQMGAKSGMQWRSFYIPFASEMPPGTHAFGSSLHGLAFGEGGSMFLMPLDFGPDGRKVSYEDWWAGEPVVQFSDGHVTRKQLVLGLANQDGGAHVDLPGRHITSLFESSPTFVRENHAELQGEDQVAHQRDLLHVQMRTVANEVLHSLGSVTV